MFAGTWISNWYLRSSVLVPGISNYILLHSLQIIRTFSRIIFNFGPNCCLHASFGGWREVRKCKQPTKIENSKLFDFTNRKQVSLPWAYAEFHFLSFKGGKRGHILQKKEHKFPKKRRHFFVRGAKKIDKFLICDKRFLIWSTSMITFTHMQARILFNTALSSICPPLRSPFPLRTPMISTFTSTCQIWKIGIRTQPYPNGCLKNDASTLTPLIQSKRRNSNISRVYLRSFEMSIKTRRMLIFEKF